MDDNVQIQGLEFEIRAGDTGKATASVNRLKKSLEGLQNVTKNGIHLKSTAQELRRIADMGEKLEKGANGVYTIASALQKLDKVSGKNVTEMSAGIWQIAEALDALDPSYINALTSLSTAIGTLHGKSNGVNTTARALKKLDDVSGNNIGSLALGLDRIGESLGKINPASAAALSSLAGAIGSISGKSTGAQRLADGLSTISGLSFTNLGPAADAIERMANASEKLRDLAKNMRDANKAASAPGTGEKKQKTTAAEDSAKDSEKAKSAAKKVTDATEEAAEKSSEAQSKFFQNMDASAVEGLSKLELLRRKIQMVREQLSEGMNAGTMNDSEITNMALNLNSLKESYVKAEKAQQTLTDGAKGLSGVMSALPGVIGTVSKAIRITITVIKGAIALFKAIITPMKIMGQISFEVLVKSTQALAMVFSRMASAVTKATIAFARFTTTSIGRVTAAVGKGTFAVGKFAGTVMAMPFKALAERISGTLAPIKNFVSSLGRILMYRVVRSTIKEIGEAIKTGIENLYQWSKALDGTFAHSMDTAATSLLYLKNSFGAMTSPLINSFVPVLDMMVDRLVVAINYVNQLFAALTGSSTYTRAIKQVQEYAEAEEDATKAVKDFLMGFDELNVIDDSGNSRTKKIADYANMFEEVPVDSGIGKWAEEIKALFKAGAWDDLTTTVADGINNALENVYNLVKWEHLRDRAISVINDFTSVINGLVKKIDWPLLGNTIGAGLNSIIHIFREFAESVEWKNIGKVFSDAIYGIFEEIEWDNLGASIADMLNIAIDFLTGAVEALKEKWEKIGSDFATAINEFVDTLKFKELAETIANGINGIARVINTMADEIHWDDIIETIVDGINTFVQTADWKSVGTAFGKVVSKMTEVISGVFGGIDWKEVGKSFGDALGDFVDNLDFKQIGTMLGNILNAVGNTLGGFADAFADKWADLGRGIGDAVNSFLNEGDFNQLVSSVVKIVNGIVTGIFNVIETIDWNMLAVSIANAFNTFVNEFDFGSFGYTIGTLIGKIAETITTAFTEADFTSFGQNVGFGINGLINGYLESGGNIGEAIAAIINAGIEGATGLLQTLDWNKLVGAISDTLSGFLKNTDWVGAIATLVDSFLLIVNGAIETFKIQSENIAWTDIGNTIAEQINKVFNELNIDDAVDTLVDLLNGVITALAEAIGIGESDGIDWDNLTDKLETAFEDFFEGIDFNKAGKTVGTLVGKIAKVIADVLDGSHDEMVKAIQSFVNGAEAGIAETRLASSIKSIGDAFTEMFVAAVSSINWDVVLAYLLQGLMNLFMDAAGVVTGNVGLINLPKLEFAQEYEQWRYQRSNYTVPETPWDDYAEIENKKPNGTTGSASEVVEAATETGRVIGDAISDGIADGIDFAPAQSKIDSGLRDILETSSASGVDIEGVFNDTWSKVSTVTEAEVVKTVRHVEDGLTTQKRDISTSGQTIETSNANTWSRVRDVVNRTTQDVSNTIRSYTGDTSADITSSNNAIDTSTDGAWRNMDSVVSTVTESITTAIEDATGSWKSDNETAWTDIESTMTTKSQTGTTNAQQSLSGLQTFWDNMRFDTSPFVNAIDTMIRKAEELRQSVTTNVGNFVGNLFGGNSTNTTTESRSGYISASGLSFPTTATPSTNSFYMSRSSQQSISDMINSRISDGLNSAVGNIAQLVNGVQMGAYNGTRAALQGNQTSTSNVNVFLDGRQITSAVEQRQRERGYDVLGGVVYA